MQMIMMMNRKGGVAKTTNAVAITRCFAAGQKGLRASLTQCQRFLRRGFGL